MASVKAKKPSRQQVHDQWAEIPREERTAYFKGLDNKHAQDLFLKLNAQEKAGIIRELDKAERRLWLRLLDPDDAVDVVQEFEPEERHEVIDLFDHTNRNHINALLAYGEDVAGGLMNPQYVRVRPEMRVAEAVRYVHKQALDQVETMYYVYVLDPEQKLLGMLSFRELFTSPPGEIVSDFMHTGLITAAEDMDQEELGRLFEQHNLLAIPVVDASNHMKGIVTVDDIVDVVQEEATEDIQKAGGVEALDAPYLEISFLTMVKKRAGWLTVLFLGELLTATAMGYYQNEIAKAVVLALFLPLIISSGGNAGSQASTLVVRAMALGEVGLHDWLRVAKREIIIGLALGAILAAIGLARVLCWQVAFHAYGQYYFLIAITIYLSLVGVVLWGTISGALLPIILRRAGFDPASASTPFVATLVDVTGLVIYFSIATVVLRGTLL
jgi:magnesium transporter